MPVAVAGEGPVLALQQLLLRLEQGRPAALGEQLLARASRSSLASAARVALQRGDALLAACPALLVAPGLGGRLASQQVDLLDLPRQRREVLVDARPDGLDGGQDGPVGFRRTGADARGLSAPAGSAPDDVSGDPSALMGQAMPVSPASDGQSSGS